MPVHNSSKDKCHGVVIKFIDGDGVEVTEEARGDGIPPSPGWAHGCNEENIHQVHGSVLLEIIPNRKESKDAGNHMNCTPAIIKMCSKVLLME